MKTHLINFLLLFVFAVVIIMSIHIISRKTGERPSEIIPKSSFHAGQNQEPKTSDVGPDKEHYLDKEISPYTAKSSVTENSPLLPLSVYKFEANTTYQQEVRKIHDLDRNLSRNQILDVCALLNSRFQDQNSMNLIEFNAVKNDALLKN